MRRLTVFVVLGIVVGGCSKKQEDAPPPAESAAKPVASAPASAAPAKQEPPPVPEPVAWERAYQASLKPQKAPPKPLPKVGDKKDPFPACANFTGREMLEEKYAKEIQQQGYKRQLEVAALDNELTKREVNANAIKRDLDRAMAKGFHVTHRADAKQLTSFAAPGQGVDAEPVPAPDAQVARWQSELAAMKVEPGGYLCDVMGVHRAGEWPSKLAKEAKAATKVSGQTWVDWIACDVPGTQLRTVVPVPQHSWHVTVKNEDGGTLVEKYESRDIAPKAIRSILQDDPEKLVGKRLKIQGVTHLERHNHGALAYKRLTQLGFPTKLGIKVAEYKDLWVTTFDVQCGAAGLACDERDGRGPIKLEIVAKEPVEEIPLAPPTPESEAGEPEAASSPGLWEAAALEVADLEDGKSGGFDKAFDPAPPEGARLLANLVPPGSTSTLTQASPPDPPNAAAWRAAIKKAGGLKPWTCTVLDMGEEVKSPTSPETVAALRALEQQTDEAHYWNVVCEGDDNSYNGPIFVFIPTYEAYPVAKVDGNSATVEKYVATRHGFFAKSLRGKLHRVGVGSKLRFTAPGWLDRRPYASNLFRRSWGAPRWAVHYGKHACRHEGLGCKRLSGPIVEVVDLKDCDIEGYEYP